MRDAFPERAEISVDWDCFGESVWMKVFNDCESEEDRIEVVEGAAF